MQKFNNHFSKRNTPQSQAIPGREDDMVRNAAGGMTFSSKDNAFLMRFLATGAGAGTYNVGSTDMTASLSRLHTIVDSSDASIVDTVVNFSQAGRAPSNDPALFVLALCMSSKNSAVAKAALNPSVLPKVARIGTHLFTIATYLKELRGWGKSMRRTFSHWYNSKEIPTLVNQVLKYRSRNGWTHRDILRKCHARATSDTHQDVYAYVTTRDKVGISNVAPSTIPNLPSIQAFHKVQGSLSVTEVCDLVEQQGMPWEYIPTDYLRNPDIWNSLIKHIPLGALLRNLGRISSLGILGPDSRSERMILEKLSNVEAIHRSRLHPISILNAFRTYGSGSGERGGLVWTPNSRIVEHLSDFVFMNSFRNVRSSGKRMMVSLDVSGSMDSYKVSSSGNVSCREASIAMSMATVAAEEDCLVTAFSDTLKEIDIDPNGGLMDNVNRTWGMSFSRTDCAQPMLYAMKHNLKIDTFVIYTDNETWAGRPHPSQALEQYRQQSGINAKLVSVAMTGRLMHTIADPRDPGMLDIAGFDTATPNVISAFSNM